MQRRKYIVQDKMGLHARSVSLIARMALSYQEAEITISCRDKTVPATHLMAVMAMLIRHGDTIFITVNGGDEAEIADTMINLLRSKGV